MATTPPKRQMENEEGLPPSAKPYFSVQGVAQSLIKLTSSRKAKKTRRGPWEHICMYIYIYISYIYLIYVSYIYLSISEVSPPAGIA